MSCLSPSQRQLLAERGHSHQLSRGDSIFRQGEQPRSMFLVDEGLVKVTCSSGTGRDIITELLFPGDVCGVLCGLDSRPYPVSAVCLTPTRITEVPVEDFLKVSSQDDGLFGACSDVCRAKMHFQRDMTVAMAVERVEQRAARVLCMLAKRLGKPGPNGLELDFPLSRQDFSELIGTALETGIRALSSLRKQGLLEESGEHHLTLPDWPALQKLAEGS